MGVNKTNLNVHLYVSSITHESRILRISKAASEFNEFDQVHIVGYKDKKCPNEEFIDDRRKIVRLPSWHSTPKIRSIAVLRYFLWYFHVIWHYCRKNIAIVHSNGVEDLIPGVLLKWLNPNSNLVYDAHELETERAGWSKFNKQIVRFVERRLIKQADVIYVVSESIKKWYEETYNLKNVFLVRNISEGVVTSSLESINLRAILGIEANKLVYIYQGAFFEGRGLEEIVKAFALVKDFAHLILLGYGRLEDKLRMASEDSLNIHILPPAHPDHILSYTMQADIGLCLIEDVSLSYKYCLPNKLFEYLHAGVPILVSDLPELSMFINENLCGWKVRCNYLDIYKFIKYNTIEETKTKAAKVDEIKLLYSWSNEKDNVLLTYKNLLSNTYKS